MGYKTILNAETTRKHWHRAASFNGGLLINAYREEDGSIVYGQCQKVLKHFRKGKKRDTFTGMTDQLLSIPYRIRVWPKRQLTPADYRAAV